MDVADAPRVRVEATSTVLARWAGGPLPLTDVEFERAAALRHEADRQDYLAAHLLGREVAGRAVGLAAPAVELTARCPDCGSRRHGPASVVGHPGQAVSLSHTRGFVAAAAGPGQLGIDAERTDATIEVDVLAPDVLTPGEAGLVAGASSPRRAFLRLWVRKEALLKAGRTTLDTLATIDVSGPGIDPAHDGQLSTWDDLHLLDLTITDGAGEAFVAVAATRRPVWPDPPARPGPSW